MGTDEPEASGTELGRPERQVPSLAAIVAVAIALRSIVALLSIGSNDVLLWHRFGREAAIWPFAEIWARDDWVNHPPLPIAYGRLCYAIAGDGRYAFALLLKLPALIGDAVSTWLIGRIATARLDAGRGRRLAWMYALNPLALIIVGYHGNLDGLLAMLVLLTWHLADRDRDGAAGAALGASLNVKLAPAVSLFLFAASIRRPGGSRRALAALAVAAIPFAWAFWSGGRAFYNSVVGYRPYITPWLLELPAAFQDLPGVGPIFEVALRMHGASAVPVAFLWAAVLRFRDHRRHRRDPRLEIGALYWCGVLAWQGSAFQYSIWVLPLLSVVRPRLAMAYGVATAVWLTFAYAGAWTGTFPPVSYFVVQPPHAVQLLTLGPLILLLVAAASLWREPPRTVVAATPSEPG